MSVLISSAGRRGALTRIFLDAARSMPVPSEVIAADCSQLAAAGVLADQFVLVPRCNNSEFIPRIIELCQVFGVRLIVPTIDTELAVLAANQDLLRSVGVLTLISSPDVVRIGSDKLETFAWLTDCGFPTVRTAPIQDVLDAQGDWPLPVIVKPITGSASAGVFRVETRSELEARATQPNLIAQEIALGEEYTVDAWVDADGRCTCTVPRLRLEVRAGEVQKAVTVHHPELESLVHDIAVALPGAYGPLAIQVFVSGKQLRVIEINTRFGGGYPLSCAAGANFARWAVEDSLGETSSRAKCIWQDGVVMLRYDDAVFVEAESVGL